jgi:methionine-rich copper-binding protein CopC
MQLMKIVSASVLALTATVALAHAHLQKAVPANGALVNASPAAIALTFSEAAKLTACWLQKGNGPKQKIDGLGTTAAREISVPVPQLQPGVYVLSWRAVGEDGHVVPGQIQFTVAAAPPPGTQPAPH